MTASSDVRVRRCVAVVVACCLGICATAWSIDPQTQFSLSRVALAFAVLIAAEVPWLNLRVGHDKSLYGFGEAGVFIVMTLLPLPLAMAACLAVSVVHNVVLRREAAKLTFNVACRVCEFGIAGLILSPFASAGHLVGLVPLLTLTLGCVLGGTVTELALTWVMANVQDVPFLNVLRLGLRTRLVMQTSSVALGLIVVLVARHSPFTLLALPVIALLLVNMHRGNLRKDQEDDVWRHLEEAGQEIKQLAEEDIVPLAVARTAALLRSDRVELVLREHDNPDKAQLYTGTIRGLLDEPLPAPAPLAVPHDAFRLEPLSQGEETIVEVGLNGPEAPLGVLRVAFSGEVVFADRERQVLATYARNLGTTISNARLYADALREAELKAWLAHHDSLTGLLNRSGLLTLSEEIDADVESARKDKTSRELFAVLVLDMDHFKEVNDTLGHEAGDRLLQHVSYSLAQRVRRQDVAARLEGDRFAVLLRHLPDDDMVAGIVEDILRVVSDPTDLDGMRLSLECSVGYAVAPLDGDTIEELLTHADVAAGQAKQSPGSSRRWRAEPDTARSRMALSADMRLALESGTQLLLHYQPKIDLRTGAVASVEALARWEHPERGMLSLAEFIPLAEQSGLARPFTLAVIDAAVKEAAAWLKMGLGGGEVTIAVNLSARNLLDHSLPSDVTTICARHGLPTRQLVLEITESVMVSELEIVTEVLSKLRKVGVQLSVDDFGTGYSSLKFLQSVQVNEVKIDRSFVATMLENPGDAAIVGATIDLGHALGLRVVAEGVETQEQLEALAAADCDAVQGFLLARPMPAASLRAALMPDNGVVVPMRPVRRRTTA